MEKKKRMYCSHTHFVLPSSFSLSEYPSVDQIGRLLARLHSEPAQPVLFKPISTQRFVTPCSVPVPVNNGPAYSPEKRKVFVIDRPILDGKEQAGGVLFVSTRDFRSISTITSRSIARKLYKRGWWCPFNGSGAQLCRG